MGVNCVFFAQSVKQQTREIYFTNFPQKSLFSTVETFFVAGNISIINRAGIRGGGMTGKGASGGGGDKWICG